MMNSRLGKSSHSNDDIINKKKLHGRTAPLPPPATFSRTSTKDILELNQQQSRDGDTSSDRSIRSEVFGGGEEAVQSQLAKQHRVRARQAAEDKKTMARRQRNQKRSEQADALSCDSSASASVGGNSIATFSTARSLASARNQRQTQQQEADEARLDCLVESLEGREEEKVSLSGPQHNTSQHP